MAEELVIGSAEWFRWTCPHCKLQGWYNGGFRIHPRYDHDRADGRRCRRAEREWLVMQLPNKGDHIRAKWFVAKPLGTYSIAGAQPKVVGDFIEVSGVVRHVRGNDPVSPTVVRVFIDPDGEWTGPMERPPGCTCEKPHVAVRPQHIEGLKP